MQIICLAGHFAQRKLSQTRFSQCGLAWHESGYGASSLVISCGCEAHQGLLNQMLLGLFFFVNLGPIGIYVP
jgi:hypothetical protein